MRERIKSNCIHFWKMAGWSWQQSGRTCRECEREWIDTKALLESPVGGTTANGRSR